MRRDGRERKRQPCRQRETETESIRQRERETETERERERPRQKERSLAMTFSPITLALLKRKPNIYAPSFHPPQHFTKATHTS